jgi:hypothetical protein
VAAIEAAIEAVIEAAIAARATRAHPFSRWRRTRDWRRSIVRTRAGEPGASLAPVTSLIHRSSPRGSERAVEAGRSCSPTAFFGGRPGHVCERLRRRSAMANAIPRPCAFYYVARAAPAARFATALIGALSSIDGIGRGGGGCATYVRRDLPALPWLAPLPWPITKGCR